MSSPKDRSPFVEPLPARPNLEMQQKRAKELLRSALAGDSGALTRIRALHPQPPALDALTLSDAQLVVARGYGFANWAAMKRKIESLMKTPVEQFLAALYAGDVAEVRNLLNEHADVRAAVNEPICHFNSRPAAQAKKNLPLLDVLLANGADLNLKSTWWAGGFGLLEYGCTPEEAAPLIARGAIVDVFAAAHLGMFDRLRELVDADPSLVHARGGDGKTPLHCARTVEMARYLLDRGADIDARCVDHESTPVQYLVREAPDVARVLVDRGAWFDIFAAVGLRDPILVERCLRDDPSALDHRTWHGLYTVAHDNTRPATREEIGDRRGDIYRWVFGHNVSAIDAAVMLGFDDIVALLLRHASPVQRLLAACTAGDRAAAQAVVDAQPGIVSTLGSGQMRLIADRAHANDLAGRRPDDRPRVRFARARRRGLGAASLGRLPRKRRHGPAAADARGANRGAGSHVRRPADRAVSLRGAARLEPRHRRFRSHGSTAPRRRRASRAGDPAHRARRRGCRPSGVFQK